MREILELRDVCLTYQAGNGEVEALRDVSFSAWEGELISIVGPSGCGKSTLLSIVAGLVRPTGGEIKIAGTHVSGVSDKIGYMLQKDNLLDWRSIRSNVLLGLEIRKMLRPENIEYADSLLEIYGLAGFGDKYPPQLSGGMRQRAALIRTLAVRPELLLLDEAFSALDYQTRLAVTEDVCGILKKEKKTALIVTHDIPEGISLADRVISMSERPGTARAVHKMVFESEKGAPLTPLQRRNHPDFGKYFNLIWGELNAQV